jgi:hypothetical protein
MSAAARSLALRAERLDRSDPVVETVLQIITSISAQYLSATPMNVVNAAWPRSCHQAGEAHCSPLGRWAAGLGT